MEMLYEIVYNIVEYNILICIIMCILIFRFFILSIENDGFHDASFFATPLLIFLIVTIVVYCPMITPEYKQGHNDYPNDTFYLYAKSTNDNSWSPQLECYIYGFESAQFEDAILNISVSVNVFKGTKQDINQSYVNEYLNDSGEIA